MTEEQIIQAAIDLLRAKAESLKDPREAMTDLSSVNARDDTRALAQDDISKVDQNTGYFNQAIKALQAVLTNNALEPISVAPSPAVSADALEQSRTMAIAASLLSMPQAEMVSVTLGQPVNK